MRAWAAESSGLVLEGGMAWPWLPDLDQTGVAIETEDFAAGGSDVLWSPGRMVDQVDGGLADGFETCEPIDDLCAELGLGGFVGVCRGEGELNFVASWDAGYVGAGCFVIGCKCDGADEAEIDDVTGQYGIIAVAKSGEDLRFSEHGEGRQLCAAALSV